MKQPKTFRIVKRFTAGVLAGLTYEGISAVAFEVGKEYTSCVGSGRYIVEVCEEVAQ
jgi:hypothetical protein